MARKRFLVIQARIERKRLPAVFCKPSLMIFIPYRKRHTAPNKARKSTKE